jgi:hypothetical protein
MRLSFDYPESFMEAAGSLRFNNPQSDSDPDTDQQVGSSSMPHEERNDSEDICFNDPSNDPNTAIGVKKMLKKY